MTIQDILNSAQDPRFGYWLNFICHAEATLSADGSIIVENDHDGAGLTMCGLNQRDDGLEIDSNGNCLNPPEWFATSYYAAYWVPSKAGELPLGAGEEVANIAVNEGVHESALILQQSITALGISLALDGIVGQNTENAAFKEDSHALCLQIASYNDAHYQKIAAMRPDLRANLRGWLNRDQLMVQAFADEATQAAPVSTVSPNQVATTAPVPQSEVVS